MRAAAPAAPQAPLHGGRHAVGALRRQPGGHERLRHEALAERRESPSSMSGMSRVVDHGHSAAAGPVAACHSLRAANARRPAPPGGRRRRRGRRRARRGSLSQKHELAAGGGRGLGDDVHGRRLDLGEKDVRLGGGARPRGREPAPVGEVARDEHDLGAVVLLERRASRGAARLRRGREEGDAAAADRPRGPRPEHRRHDLDAGPHGCAAAVSACDTPRAPRTAARTASARARR